MANTDKQSWRDLMPVHPAADLFPMLDDADLVALGNDIKANGLKSPITAIDRHDGGKPHLVDGRNRLAALERVGVRLRLEEPNMNGGRRLKGSRGSPKFWLYTLIADDVALQCGGLSRPALDIIDGDDDDPVAYMVSANLRRRHLDGETKRKLVANLLKEKPERSDRQTAEIAKVDHKTVGVVRREMETSGELPQLAKRTGKDGKKRSANQRAAAGEKLSTVRLVPAPPAKRGKEAVRERVHKAVATLSGLPKANEVASYFDGEPGANLIRERLPIAVDWINQFASLINRDAAKPSTMPTLTESNGVTVTLPEEWREPLVVSAEKIGVGIADYVDLLLRLGSVALNRKIHHGLTHAIEAWLVEMHGKHPTFNTGFWEGSCGPLSIDKLYAKHGRAVAPGTEPALTAARGKSGASAQ